MTHDRFAHHRPDGRGTYVEGPNYYGGAPPVQSNDEELSLLAGSPPPAAREVEPPYHACSAERSTAFKVLQGIMYVLVILTCLATLYTLLEFHLWVQQLKEGLQEFSNSLNDGGLFGG